MAKKSGWEKEIIDPFNALIAPRTLLWKEKYGTLRCEWLQGPNGVEEVGPMEMVLEEASKLCCMECGRWNNWQHAQDKYVTVVANKPVRGWWTTLCGECRGKAEAIIHE